MRLKCWASYLAFAWIVIHPIVIYAGISSQDALQAIEARNNSFVSYYLSASEANTFTTKSQEVVQAAIAHAKEDPANAASVFNKMLKTESSDNNIRRREISTYQRGEMLCQTDRWNSGMSNRLASDGESFRELTSPTPGQVQLTISPVSAMAANGELLNLDSLFISSNKLLSKPFKAFAEGDGWRISVQVAQDQITSLHFDTALDLVHLSSVDSSGPVVEMWYWGYHTIGDYSVPHDILTWNRGGALGVLSLVECRINVPIADKDLRLPVDSVTTTIVDRRHSPPLVRTVSSTADMDSTALAVSQALGGDGVKSVDADQGNEVKMPAGPLLASARVREDPSSGYSVAIISLIVAGIAVTMGAYYFFRDRHRRRQS